jgi:hypothetical protein
MYGTVGRLLHVGSMGRFEFITLLGRAIAWPRALGAQQRGNCETA